MERIFGIIPASSGPIIFMAFIAYSPKNVIFEVRDDGLRISRSLYGRFISREEIAAAGVRVFNLNIESNYQPKHRTNGAGLPGYVEGWFKLQNKEKALLFLTDRSSVVYIPTVKDYSVLLSIRDAEEFAKLIKQWE